MAFASPIATLCLQHRHSSPTIFHVSGPKRTIPETKTRTKVVVDEQKWYRWSLMSASVVKCVLKVGQGYINP